MTRDRLLREHPAGDASRAAVAAVAAPDEVSLARLERGRGVHERHDVLELPPEQPAESLEVVLPTSFRICVRPDFDAATLGQELQDPTCRVLTRNNSERHS